MKYNYPESSTKTDWNVDPRPSHPAPSSYHQTILSKAVYEHAPSLSAVAAIALSSNSIQNSSLAPNFISLITPINTKTVETLFNNCFDPIGSFRTCKTAQFTRHLNQVHLGEKSVAKFVKTMQDETKYFAKSLSKLDIQFDLHHNTSLAAISSCAFLDVLLNNNTTNSSFTTLEEIHIKFYAPAVEDVRIFNQFNETLPNLKTFHIEIPAHHLSNKTCLEVLSKLDFSVVNEISLVRGSKKSSPDDYRDVPQQVMPQQAGWEAFFSRPKNNNNNSSSLLKAFTFDANLYSLNKPALRIFAENFSNSITELTLARFNPGTTDSDREKLQLPDAEFLLSEFLPKFTKLKTLAIADMLCLFKDLPFLQQVLPSSDDNNINTNRSSKSASLLLTSILPQLRVFDLNSPMNLNNVGIGKILGAFDENVNQTIEEFNLVFPGFNSLDPVEMGFWNQSDKEENVILLNEGNNGFYFPSSLKILRLHSCTQARLPAIKFFMASLEHCGNLLALQLHQLQNLEDSKGLAEIGNAVDKNSKPFLECLHIRHASRISSGGVRKFILSKLDLGRTVLDLRGCGRIFESVIENQNEEEEFGIKFNVT